MNRYAGSSNVLAQTLGTYYYMTEQKNSLALGRARVTLSCVAAAGRGPPRCAAPPFPRVCAARWPRFSSSAPSSGACRPSAATPRRCAAALASPPTAHGLTEPPAAAAPAPQLAHLAAELRGEVDLKDPKLRKLHPGIQKSLILLAAQVNRLGGKLPEALAADMVTAVETGTKLLEELVKIVMRARPPHGYVWMRPVLSVLEYSQHFVQAVPIGRVPAHAAPSPMAAASGAAALFVRSSLCISPACACSSAAISAGCAQRRRRVARLRMASRR